MIVQNLLDTCVQFGPVVVCLLETKQQDDNFDSLMRRINLIHYDAVAAEGLSGGIFVGWNDSFSVSSLRKYRNFMDLVGTTIFHVRIYFGHN